MVQIQSKEEALEQGSDKKSSYQLAVEQPMDFMKLQDLLFNDDIQRAKLFPEGESNQVSLFDRIRADLKGDISPVGEFNFLKEIFGENNVIARNDGNFFIREAPGKTYVELNPEGFQMKDVAELSGEAVVIAPTMFTANPWLAGLYAIGGGTTLQAIGETIPGETEIEAGDRLKKIAAEGVFGAGGQYGANVVIDFFSRLGVKNFIVNKALKALEKRGAMGKDFFERGEELTQKVGKLTFGEISGDAGLKSIEDFLRSYYLTRGATMDLADEQLNAAKNAILKFIQTSYNAANDPMAKRTGVSLGADIQRSFKSVLDSFVDLRSSNASKLYNQTKFITDSTGKQVNITGLPTIKITEINKTLDEMKETAKLNQDDTLYKSLIQWQDSLNKKAKNGLIPYEVFNRQMSIFGKASYGKGSAFKNLETAAQRGPAKELFGAYSRALNDTIESFDQGLKIGGVDDAINAEVASNLKVARDQYKADSELIDQLENSFIRDFISPGASKSKASVVQRFQKLEPEEIDYAFQLLRGTGNEAVIQDIKKSFITDVFEDSLTAIKDLDLNQMSTAEVGRVIKEVFEPNKFLDNLNQKVGNERLKVLFTEKELDRLGDITEYIQRVNFNNVKPKAAILDIIISFINPKEALIRIAGLKKMTNLMFDPKGIDALKAALKALESDKPMNEIYRNVGGDLLNFYLLAETEPTDYLQKYLDVAGQYYNLQEPSIQQQIQQSGIERFGPEYQKQQEEALQDLQSFNISSPQVSRGQGVDVIPPLSTPINPRTVASLESVGMPLFTAAEGGIVDLYESKKFKKPQVVA